MADTHGNWVCRPHHGLINRHLLRVTSGQVKRLGCHVPWQTGKTTLCSEYFAAWRLLLNPELRIILGSHSASFSEDRGAAVREIINRHGGPFNVKLRDDSKAKGNWRIQSRHRAFDGGMVCRGYGGGIQGRPADLFLLDDMIENAEQAMSATIKQKIWDWYCTVVFGRLGPNAPVINVCTRWASDDLAGRLYKEQKHEWTIIKLRALAESDDPLGRKVGEPLWEDRRPLEQVLEAKRIGGRWWSACWQQDPQDQYGLFFRPNPTVIDGQILPGWPRWSDLGNAYSLPRPGGRTIVLKEECTRLCGADFSLGRKSTSDLTAKVIADLTPNGQLIILHVDNRRLRYEQLAPELDDLCRDWYLSIVAVDDDMIAEAALVDCRRFPHIPELRQLPIRGQAKLARAHAAITHGENGRIFLPSEKEPWDQEFCDQLAGFTGEDGGVDDMADALGIVGRMADGLKPMTRQSNNLPEILVEGKYSW